MQQKKINVFFSKILDRDSTTIPPQEIYENTKHYFPFYVFFKHFAYEIVTRPQDADIIFELTRHGGTSYITYPQKIVILVSGENILMQRNLFNWMERLVGLFLKKGKKHKVMDFLNTIIPFSLQKMPISYFFPQYIEFLKSTQQNKRHFAILCNKELASESIYSYPLILADFHWRMDKLIKSTKTPAFKHKKFCAFAVSSNSDRERVKFYKQLSRYKVIDSHGLVMNNTGSKVQKDWRDNPDLFSRYKFVICFENSYVDDFITEKLTNAMLSGAIPIYRGPLNTKDYFNTASFINYDDYGSYEAMIQKIIELDTDDTQYQALLAQPWYHDNKLPKAFKEKEQELIKFYKKILAKNDLQ